MAFSSIASACVQGLHIEVIHAESDVSNGLPMFHMAKSTNFHFPSKTISNLSRGAFLEIFPPSPDCF